jgi:hypothetical protein
MAPSEVAAAATSLAFLPRSTSKKFPYKCHDMLSYVEKNNLEHIVSWLPGGKGFQIHDDEAFCKQVLKPTFNHSNYKSFEKQLNNWNFTKVNARAYSNPNFQRGRKSLCQSMTSKSTRTKKSVTAAAEAPKSTYNAAAAANDHTIVTPALAAAMANEEAARAQQLATAAAAAGVSTATSLAPSLEHLDANSKVALIAALQQRLAGSEAQKLALVRALVRKSALDQLKLQQQFQRQQQALLADLQVGQHLREADLQQLLLAAHQRQQQSESQHQQQLQQQQASANAALSPSPSTALLQKLATDQEEQKERAAALLALRVGRP